MLDVHGDADGAIAFRQLGITGQNGGVFHDAYQCRCGVDGGRAAGVADSCILFGNFFCCFCRRLQSKCEIHYFIPRYSFFYFIVPYCAQNE